MKIAIIILTGLFIFSSCEKVIKVDLNDTEKRIIIQGNYSGDGQVVDVKISLTSSYFDNSTSPNLDNAVVTISDQTGSPQNVPSIGNGKYQLLNYAPTAGATYTMTVVYDGIEYKASSILNSTIAQDPMHIEYEVEEPGPFGEEGEEGFVAYINYTDPASTTDFYQVVTHVNGEQMEKYVSNDKFINGSTVIDYAYGFLKSGDTINIDLRTINEATHDYYVELSTLNDGNVATPANPKYQWSNRGLGYFSVFGSSVREHIIP